MPQRTWSAQEERQYQHIVESEHKRGSSRARAKEVAARTVNKQRREAGKTARSRTSGTGNPNRGLEDRTRDELYDRAKEMNIAGRSSMSKQELIRAIRGHR